MDPLTILGIAGGVAVLVVVVWLLYQFRTGLQAKRGEKEREAEVEELEETIRRDRSRGNRRGLLGKLRDGKIR